MDYEEHFAKEELHEFKIGGDFAYKPVMAGQENDWANEYLEIDKETGKYKENIAKLNKCKMRNLMKVPYGKELIKEKIGKSKEWSELNHLERWELLRKLTPAIFTQIINEINKADRPTEKKT